jgi:hypothetical protein
MYDNEYLTRKLTELVKGYIDNPDLTHNVVEDFGDQDDAENLRIDLYKEIAEDKALKDPLRKIRDYLKEIIEE